MTHVFEVDFLCLANSTREGGHCVAGIDLDSGKWIRPVGPSDGKLSNKDILISGTKATIRPFDIVTLRHGAPTPIPGQAENHLIPDTGPIFKPIAQSSAINEPIRLHEHLHDAEQLFNLGVSFRRDRVSHEDIITNKLEDSLTLLLVQDPVFHDEPEGKVRMDVPYQSEIHSLRITDPLFGSLPRTGGPWVTCISLGAEFKGFHYGLVAMAVRIQDIPQKFVFAPARENVSSVPTRENILPFAGESTLSKQTRKDFETRFPGLLEKSPRAYSTWSQEEDDYLTQTFKLTKEVDLLASLHRRQSGAIQSRLNKLGLT